MRGTDLEGHVDVVDRERDDCIPISLGQVGTVSIATEWSDRVLLGERGAFWASGLVILDGVPGKRDCRYRRGVPLHVGDRDSAALSTIPRLALVV